MGSIDQPSGVHPDPASYSVPEEASKVFYQGILQNDMIAKDLPDDVHEAARNVVFTGSTKPSIPVNWRFAESAAALKALESTLVAALLKRKYNVPAPAVEINTDHASLFLMSTLLWKIDPHGENIGIPSSPSELAKLSKYIPSTDLHRISATLHRASATNIYRCKDGAWFHLHGSMNPEPTLDSVGLPYEMEAASPEESWKPYFEKLATITSTDMQHRAESYRQAGTICNTTTQYFASEHGKANSHVGLWEIHPVSTTQPPAWWPSTPHTSPSRPLAGLKVIDLTRIIASPAITRGLAELGASVLRITAPHLADYSSLHVDLNWGKWNAHLDLRTESGRVTLRELVKDADVVVNGYRPGVLDKYGFSQSDIVDMVSDRDRGIISVRENCYGWHGPWAHRSGWQQVSDANVGISHAYGRAMGLHDDEAVTPVFPNSDYMTGIAGVCAVLIALVRRAEAGGSYKVDTALNYYNAWLARSVGEYPSAVWADVWVRNGKPVFRAWHNMAYTIPRVLGGMVKSGAGKDMFEEGNFEERESRVLGVTIRTVRPVLRYTGEEVKLGYNVGTRGNGVDQVRWPADLMSEVVK
jgi:crotonobetainyl-CoA:carnitine CoA-transferase CaiB-like acyl-CoA transferase